MLYNHKNTINEWYFATSNNLMICIHHIIGHMQRAPSHSIHRTQSNMQSTHRSRSSCCADSPFRFLGYHIGTSLKLKHDTSNIFSAIRIIILVYCHFTKCFEIKGIYIPAGHRSLLQSCCSAISPLHSPPFVSWDATLRPRICVPLPHVLLQVDQSPQDSQTQSAVKNENMIKIL